ncbi:MAG: DUF4428 domain-containing protein [Clostridiaceae bacterium]|jgi:protein-arginine kinase activator protein McsA|nr:DUF4428 domain-containing protein [Clostridiaceae bacterium]
MGIFDRKVCDVCGGKAGLLGGKKVKDGRLCSECAKKQSPYLSSRKNFTVDEMKQHLEDRAANQVTVREFEPTRTGGSSLKLYLDDARGLWFITRSRRYQEDNPDVFTAEQILGARIDIEKGNRVETIERAIPAKDGKPAVPAKTKEVVYYNFYVLIDVSHPWVNQMRLKVNSSSLEGGPHHPDYKEAQRDAGEIVEMLLAMRDGAMAEKQEKAKPKQRVVCPHCGATTTPDENGACQYCMGAIG